MKFNFEVKVRISPHIFDPQAATIEKTLKKMSYPVSNVSVGKIFYFSIESSSLEQANLIAEKISKEVLSNPILETFELESNDK